MSNLDIWLQEENTRCINDNEVIRTRMYSRGSEIASMRLHLNRLEREQAADNRQYSANTTRAQSIQLQLNRPPRAPSRPRRQSYRDQRINSAITQLYSAADEVRRAARDN